MPTTKKKSKPRNRAAQDATLVNVRAAKKRDKTLGDRVTDLERIVTSLTKQVTALEAMNGLLAD